MPNDEVTLQALAQQIGGLANEMREGFSATHERMDSMDKRFDNIDTRLDHMDTRFDSMNTRLSGAEQQVRANNKIIIATNEAITSLAEQVSKLSANVAAWHHHMKAFKDEIKEEFHAQISILGGQIRHDLLGIKADEIEVIKDNVAKNDVRLRAIEVAIAA